MTGPFWRILLFIVLAALSMASLKEMLPGMTEPASFLLSVLGLGLLFWFFRPKAAPATFEPLPPTLEQLEQDRAAQPALKWEK